MKCFVLCVCVAVFAAVHAAPSAEEAELLKRLVRLLEGKDAQKRYHYTKPQVDPSMPGQLWVDLQSVVEVEKKCPDCLLFVACKCISADCHNKKENHLPQNGYTWKRFKEVFVDAGKGDWIKGLEDGMEYEVWDVVIKADGSVYEGYENTARDSVTIPKTKQPTNP